MKPGLPIIQERKFLPEPLNAVDVDRLVADSSRPRPRSELHAHPPRLVPRARFVGAGLTPIGGTNKIDRHDPQSVSSTHVG